MGCVPIVLSSPLDVLYSDFPVIILKNWEDLFADNALDRFRKEIIERFGENWMQRGLASRDKKGAAMPSVPAKLSIEYWQQKVLEKKKEAMMI